MEILLKLDDVFEVGWDPYGGPVATLGSTELPAPGTEAEALQLSIRKWEWIAKLLNHEVEGANNPLYVYDGASATCALCHYFYRLPCSECPIGDCEGTPYDAYSNLGHRIMFGYAGGPDKQAHSLALTLARAEIEFLKELAIDEGGEPCESK